jgi:hypothetical protein
MRGIPFAVSPQFGQPVGLVGLWQMGTLAAVLMPKTTIHENYFLHCRKNQIGLSRQVRAVEPIAEAHGMGKSPYSHFRCCILRPDRCHQLASVH